MKQTLILSPICLTYFLLVGGCASKVEETKTPALFETRREAEKAAKSFNCTGAHKMGNKWMPCATHESHKSSHDSNIKDQNHHHQHHH